MLPKEVREKLKKDFHLDVDKLEAAIKADTEQVFELPADLTLMSAADLSARDANKMDEGRRTGESIGETKGKELAAKAFRKKFSLPDELGVDIDKITEGMNARIAGGDPLLKKQVEDLMKDNESLKTERDGAVNSAKQTQFKVGLIGMFPAKRKPGLKDDERLLLMEKDLQFETEGDKTIVKRNGAVVTHPTTHAPLAINDVISGYFAERGWVDEDETGGRGGGNSGGTGTSGIKKMTEFAEKWKAENPGKTEISPEFMAAVDLHAKDNKDFNFHE